MRRVASAGLALFFLVSLVAQDRVREVMIDLVLWVRELGWSGALVYGLAYIVATVALVPGLILTLGAGFMYGPFVGALLVFVFSVAGASAAFFVARSWWRPWVLRKLQGRGTLLSLDERVAKEGWKIVLLLRLSPLVPFSILNYLLGITKLSFRAYLGATAVGMIPGIMLYSYLGSALASLSQVSEGAGIGIATNSSAFWIGMAATLLTTILLTRWARHALREMKVQQPVLES
jgi:uncharacterized membrane protein YdjX (TVP38/TMEM64 family)